MLRGPGGGLGLYGGQHEAGVGDLGELLGGAGDEAGPAAAAPPRPQPRPRLHPDPAPAPAQQPVHGAAHLPVLPH